MTLDGVGSHDAADWAGGWGFVGVLGGLGLSVCRSGCWVILLLIARHYVDSRRVHKGKRGINCSPGLQSQKL